MITLPQDFREFFLSLNKNNVKYILIGGYAVAYYGFIRATNDLDIFIQREEQNAENVCKALVEFGFGTSDLDKNIFLQDGKIVRMGIPPLRIEILNDISGVTFEECYNNKNIVLIDNISINVINLNDLKNNKKASGRAKDLIDFDNL